MKVSLLRVVFVLWVAGSIATFGYVASHTDCEDHPVYQTAGECEVARGVFSGIFFPAYWAWEGFEQMKVRSNNLNKGIESGK